MINEKHRLFIFDLFLSLARHKVTEINVQILDAIGEYFNTQTVILSKDVFVTSEIIYITYMI